MKHLIMALLLMRIIFNAAAQLPAYDNYPVYEGNDLGLSYTKESSRLKIWAPFAESVRLVIYKEGQGGKALKKETMEKAAFGTWAHTLKGDWAGKFYAFSVKRMGKWSEEVTDPYAKAVGINGGRAMILDLRKTDPIGWERDGLAALPATEAIIYELHIRDATIAANSGIHHKGKYLGLAESGTRVTGLDHIRSLGVTHVHLLPFFDYNSVDEKDPARKYNWGYDPLNYNVPEGSYSADPYDGSRRIWEVKQLIQTFHSSGLRVVMDVVYNHTAKTENSNFNRIVPGYYYRQDANGKFSNATACNNETASERAMMRKFILESMVYWVKEYHVDGFRVDLMGVHDIETMNLISRELNKIKPGILLYGEGWTAGPSPLPDEKRALKKNAAQLDHIAVFSDDMRDGIKGSVFVHDEKGFASGKIDNIESVKFGIVASCQHPQIDYAKVNYSKAPYAKEPWQVITYCECHDNHALWDKLAISAKEYSEQERRSMQKLALAIVLSSQGIPFLHAGTEFLRSKQGVENSFDSPDTVNQLDWDLRRKNGDIVEYVKTLIRMRKEHVAFRQTSADQIRSTIRFRDDIPKGILAYTIDGNKVFDPWGDIMVIFNGNNTVSRVSVGDQNWYYFISGINYPSQQVKGEIEIAPFSCTILHKNK